MSTDYQFGVLGPLEARFAGRLLPVTAGQARVVLATLLLRRGKVVPTDLLIERMWGDDPPKSARTIAQSYVSKLRKLFDPNATEAGSRLITQYPGYVLDVDAEEVDLHRFEELAQRGRQARADGRLAEAGAALGAALDLWRGPALSNVESDPLHQLDVPRLEEARLNALEDWGDVELALGHHREVMAGLRSTATGQRERLCGQLMIALYRSGRQVDALRTFHQVRSRMVNGLGIEPGTDLQNIHRAVLRGDASLDWQPPAASAMTVSEPAPQPATEPAPGPTLLPAAHRHFVGREHPMQRASTALTGGESPAYARSVAVTGPPGIGKTAFTLQLAHGLRDQFPDGQLYLDLRGSRPDPMGAEDALAELLRPLAPRESVPAGFDARLRAYQARLLDLRVLIVLDDALDEAQVRSLLPLYPGCAVMVTSRAPLAGLVESTPMPLGRMTTGEGRLLLRQLVGPERVDAEPDAVNAVVAHCDGLPLAVRIAAARLAERPHWPVRMLAERLAAQPLAELRIGDLDVRRCLADSFGLLTGAEQRCFRTLACSGTDRIPLAAATKLLGEESHVVVDRLDRLVELRLLEATVDGTTLSYRVAGLARRFAAEQLRDEAVAVRRPHLRTAPAAVA